MAGEVSVRSSAAKRSNGAGGRSVIDLFEVIQVDLPERRFRMGGRTLTRMQSRWDWLRVSWSIPLAGLTMRTRLPAFAVAMLSSAAARRNAKAMECAAAAITV
jgi:hypothetical protein